jgi:putative ABC transport system substrate-binding protein
MNRRDTVLALLALGVAPDASFAQQPGNMYRIGFLSVGSETTRTSAAFSPLFDALRELRYVEGRNIIVERRFAAGNVERLDEFAAELVRLKVDLIVAIATPAAQAAQKATTAIPIVFLAVVDPVGAGLVTRLARPDGNITGLSFLSTEISGKRVEILKEVVPKLSRVGILSNPANASNALQLREAEAAARTLGVQPQTLEVRSSSDIEAAFQAAIRGRAGALIVLDDPLLAGFSEQTRIGTLALKHRLPTMSGFKGRRRLAA